MTGKHSLEVEGGPCRDRMKKLKLPLIVLTSSGTSQEGVGEREHRTDEEERRTAGRTLDEIEDSKNLHDNVPDAEKKRRLIRKGTEAPVH